MNLAQKAEMRRLTEGMMSLLIYARTAPQRGAEICGRNWAPSARVLERRGFVTITKTKGSRVRLVHLTDAGFEAADVLLFGDHAVPT